MSLMKGYKYRIYPNETQERELDYMMWQLRNIWNQSLAIARWHYDQSGEQLEVFDELRTYWSETMRQRHPEKYGIFTDTFIIETVVQSLDDAYKRFKQNLYKGIPFKKAGLPRFKRRGDEPGLRLRSRVGLVHPETSKVVRANSSNKHITNDTALTNDVMLKGLYLDVGYLSMPRVRIHLHRGFPDHFESVQYATITRDRGKWYISFTLRQKDYTPPAFDRIDRGVGIDVGLTYLVSESSGHQEPHHRWYNDGLPELRRLNRKLDRQRRRNNPDNYDDKKRVIPSKVKANGWVVSGNMRRTEARVKRMGEQVQNQRRHFWECYTDKLTDPNKDGYGLIAIEDLTAAYMVNNKRLSKLSADAALHFFRTRLEHKCKERGVMLIRVLPAYTSQTCRVCGCVSKENRLTQSKFQCTDCGHTENADLNASHNILARGREDVERACQWLQNNPGDLRTVAEVKPRHEKAVCQGIAKLANVHHWTTVKQCADLLLRTEVL